MGAFSLKFSIAPSGETTDWIKKVKRGANMVRTFSINMPNMVGIVGCAPAVDEKVCLFVCDNGNPMKQYHYQNNYGVIACRKVCGCAPILNFFCGPPNFLNRGKFVPKIMRCFVIFASVGPHFSSQNGEIWYEDADLGLAPPSQILQKSLKGVYPFWANLY